jgi:hypothetical protein
MAEMLGASVAQLDPRKFQDPFLTAKGEKRAQVALYSLDTLWFNTGTLCNLTCDNCYIESSPKNDRLVYLSAAEVATYLDEIADLRLGTTLIGFTGGEPFMNPEFPAMLDLVLGRGFRALVLTNAMKPMHRQKPALLALALRRPTHDPGIHRPLRPRRTRSRTRPAQLATDNRWAAMACRQRICDRDREPTALRGAGSGHSPRLCGPVYRTRARDRPR